MNLISFFQSITFLLIATIFITGTGCGNSDDDTLNGSNNQSSILTQDDGWYVSYYFDKDKEETNNFSGFSFYFKDSGVLEAVKGSSVTTGNWTLGQSDGKQRLIISFPSASEPLDDLEDDWILNELSDTDIRLEDDNDEHVEELFFRKL